MNPSAGESASTPGTKSGSIRRSSRRGNSIIEFSFIAPWYLFLFVGAFDFGFFVYSLDAVQTAARQGALYCSASVTSQCTDSSSSAQCTYTLEQLKMMPNVGSLATCGTTTSVTTSAPVSVVTTTPLAAADSPDGQANSSVGFTVVYQTPQLIPIPGILPGQLTITRTVKMRFRT
jgi:Flp pilus assembly protein TadG